MHRFTLRLVSLDKLLGVTFYYSTILMVQLPELKVHINHSFLLNNWLASGYISNTISTSFLTNNLQNDPPGFKKNVVAKQKQPISTLNINRCYILTASSVSSSENTNHVINTENNNKCQCVFDLEERTKTKRHIISSEASLGIACFITCLHCPDTLQLGEKQSYQ